MSALDPQKDMAPDTNGASFVFEAEEAAGVAGGIEAPAEQNGEEESEALADARLHEDRVSDAEASENDSVEAPARKDLLHFDADALASYRESSRAAAQRPDPKIVVTADFCVNPKCGACERCVMACPAQAVSLGEGGLPCVDTELCSLCGICLGICDAFTSNDVTMTDLAARARRAAQRGEGVFFVCAPMMEGEEDPAPCVVEVPCLAALSPEFWTSLLSEGLDVRAVCDFERCSHCERGGDVAEMLYSHAIETAQAWTGRQLEVVDEVPAKTGYLQSFVQHGDVDRRGLFTHFAGNVEDAASGEYRKRNSSVLQDFYERRERMRAQARQIQNTLPEVNRHAQAGSLMKIMQPKRRMLLDAIERDGAIAERVQLVVSDTDCKLCCNALACVAACPTSARYPEAETGLLAYDVAYCIGCGNCSRACPTGAAFMVEVPASLLDAAPGIVCAEAFEALRDKEMQEQRALRSPSERMAEAD